MNDGQDEYSERSYRGGRSYRYDGNRSYDDGRSMRRNRDSMGRYSRNYSGGFEDELRMLMEEAPDENTKQGLDMVLKAYKKVLEGEGVEEINPIGQPFDATYSEAIMAMPAEEGEESGVVKQVYVKGYKKGEKVLRYAQVIVTQ